MATFFSYILLNKKNINIKIIDKNTKNIILDLFNEDIKCYLKNHNKYKYLIFNNLKILPYIIDIKNVNQLIFTLICKINYYNNNIYIIVLYSSKTDICSICLSEYNYNDLIFLTKCNHEFHIPCLSMWLKDMDTCPICRSLLKIK